MEHGTGRENKLIGNQARVSNIKDCYLYFISEDHNPKTNKQMGKFMLELLQLMHTLTLELLQLMRTLTYNDIYKFSFIKQPMTDSHVGLLVNISSPMPVAQVSNLGQGITLTTTTAKNTLYNGYPAWCYVIRACQVTWLVWCQSTETG